MRLFICMYLLCLITLNKTEQKQAIYKIIYNCLLLTFNYSILNFVLKNKMFDFNFKFINLFTFKIYVCLFNREFSKCDIMKNTMRKIITQWCISYIKVCSWSPWECGDGEVTHEFWESCTVIRRQLFHFFVKEGDFDNFMFRRSGAYLSWMIISVPTARCCISPDSILCYFVNEGFVYCSQLRYLPRTIIASEI